MSNIQHDHFQELAERPAHEVIEESVNVHLDLDDAKTIDTDYASRDGSLVHHHERSNSFKKPATFKAVSVTRNFLAKAGAPVISTSKSSDDKGTAMPAINLGAQGARPRLVAKSNTGNQIGSKPSGHNYKSNGPDPLQVWNKNRVTPQATQKHFTDEELKQQYGIHLATRLQADADGKEAKWADIDDDEDDWAPETIEWNDGTKITLPQNEIILDTAEKQPTSQAEKGSQDEEAPKTNGTSRAINMVGPNATVLRLGAKAPTKSGGVVLKIPSDKPTLVAKPAAPPPAKSPWASLPPVDKVTPITINPPVQVSQIHFQRRESSSIIAEPASSIPAMEIAADSFSRTSRDSGGSAQGQLFNSQSGQYETVSSNRRGSNKREPNFRPPALLQRPSPNEKGTTNQSRSEISLLSRRTSIGGAESQHRTRQGPSMKETARNDMGFAREGAPELESPALASTQHELSPAVPPSASTSSPGLPRPYTFRRPGSVAEASNHASSPGAATSTMSPMTNEVNAQRQLMQESIEKARQRKQEEAQREEAARQERIKKKLEALGPLISKETEGTRSSDVKSKTSITGLQPAATDVTQKALPRELPPRAQVASEKPDSQKGLETVPKSSLVNGVAPDGETTGKMPTKIQTSSYYPTLGRGQESESRPFANGVLNQEIDKRSTSSAHENTVKTALQAHKQQPWGLEGENYVGWNKAAINPQTSSTGALWGPLEHHKAIGNGTFDQNIQRQPLRSSPYQERQSTPVLQPIGPPRPNQSNLDSDDRSRQFVQARESLHGFPPPPMSRSPSSQLQAEDKARSSQGGTFGPQQAHHLQSGNLSYGTRNQETGLNAWSHFKSNAQTIEEAQARQVSEEFAALSPEEQKKRFQGPEMSETWREVQVSGENSQRKLISVHKDDTAPENAVSSSRRVEASSYGTLPQVTSMTNTNRPSRFMPFMGTSYRTPIQQMGVRSIDAPSSPSPPPPDSSIHPAFDRSHGLPRPVVNLPGSTFQGLDTDAQGLDANEFPLDSPPEKPKVRLPPAPAALLGVASDMMSSSNFSEIRGMPLRAVSQPLVNNKAWQDRFNGLLGTTTKSSSPEKAKAARLNVPAPPAVDSTSKDSLEMLTPRVSAAVSLPVTDDDLGAASVPVQSFTKAMEDEEALFENREFGSLPTVKLAPVDNSWKQAKSSKNRKINKTPAKEVVPSSKDIPDYSRSNVAGGVLVFINIKGMVTPRSKVLRDQNPHQAASLELQHRRLSLGQKPGNNIRGRDSSGTYQQRPLHAPTQPPSHHHQMPQHAVASGPRPFYNKRQGPSHNHGQTPWNSAHRVASAAH